MAQVPKSKPQQGRDTTILMLKDLLKDLPEKDYPLVAFGIRGYYRDTMGKVGVNDRGIWDDANGWLERTGDKTYAIFNANCDPTVEYRRGVGSIHAPQIIWFKIGLHKGRKAFRQAREIMVDRDGIGLVKAGVECAFNWHDSLSGGTSSLGCQTNPKDQFQAVRELGYHLVRKHYPKSEIFPYLLVSR